jgi:hypothetical protein
MSGAERLFEKSSIGGTSSANWTVDYTRACKADAWAWRGAKWPSGWANGGSPITKEAHSEGRSNPLTGFIGREGVQLERAGEARSAGAANVPRIRSWAWASDAAEACVYSIGSFPRVNDYSAARKMAVKEACTMTPQRLDVDGASLGSCKLHDSPRSLMT